LKERSRVKTTAPWGDIEWKFAVPIDGAWYEQVLITCIFSGDVIFKGEITHLK
jgi:hypothetical protein